MSNHSRRAVLAGIATAPARGAPRLPRDHAGMPALDYDSVRAPLSLMAGPFPLALAKVIP
jgi:hypothetical protein